MEQTEKELVKSKRDLALERLHSKYPDDKFEDDEAIFGRINGDYDDYDSQIAERDKRISDYEEQERELADMYASDPRSAKFLTDWRKGEDPSIALIRLYGNDIKDIIDDPERQKEVAEANKEYAERVAKNKEYEEEYYANLNASLAYLDGLKDKGEITDDEIDEVMGVYLGVARDALMGKFTPEAFEMFRKALNHDADVANAADEGEVRGRNAKIDERLKVRRKGDGLASFGGNGGGAEPTGNQRDLGALNRFGSGDDIWKRGGEKRTKY